MTMSDRAFRALARAEPQVIVAAVRALVPGSIPAHVTATAEDVAPSQLDALPPPRDADSVLRLSDDSIQHTECQGYRDGGFVDRLLWYHLDLALRHRPRSVCKRNRPVGISGIWR